MSQIVSSAMTKSTSLPTSTVILLLRTNAIFGNDKRVATALSISYLSSAILGFYFSAKFLITLNGESSSEIRTVMAM
jgi:hypothetical protein